MDRKGRGRGGFMVSCYLEPNRKLWARLFCRCRSALLVPDPAWAACRRGSEWTLPPAGPVPEGRTWRRSAEWDPSARTPSDGSSVSRDRANIYTAPGPSIPNRSNPILTGSLAGTLARIGHHLVLWPINELTCVSYHFIHFIQLNLFHFPKSLKKSKKKKKQGDVLDISCDSLIMTIAS